MMSAILSESPQILRAEGQPVKEGVFKAAAHRKVVADQPLACGIILAIVIEYVFQPFIEVHNHVMAHPFIGIIDDFLGKKMPAGITLSVVFP